MSQCGVGLNVKLTAASWTTFFSFTWRSSSDCWLPPVGTVVVELPLLDVLQPLPGKVMKPLVKTLLLSYW